MNVKMNQRGGQHKYMSPHELEQLSQHLEAQKKKLEIEKARVKREAQRLASEKRKLQQFKRELKNKRQRITHEQKDLQRRESKVIQTIQIKSQLSSPRLTVLSPRTTASGIHGEKDKPKPAIPVRPPLLHSNKTSSTRPPAFCVCGDKKKHSIHTVENIPQQRTHTKQNSSSTSTMPLTCHK